MERKLLRLRKDRHKSRVHPRGLGINKAHTHIQAYLGGLWKVPQLVGVQHQTEFQERLAHGGDGRRGRDLHTAPRQVQNGRVLVDFREFDHFLRQLRGVHFPCGRRVFISNKYN